MANDSIESAYSIWPPLWGPTRSDSLIGCCNLFAKNAGEPSKYNNYYFYGQLLLKAISYNIIQCKYLFIIQYHITQFNHHGSQGDLTGRSKTLCLIMFLYKYSQCAMLAGGHLICLIF